MWEISKRHCCATCRYSSRNDCVVETFSHSEQMPTMDENGLFPLNSNLCCEYCRASIGEASVQAVLVRPDGCCEAYDCREERYFELYGSYPREDEEMYGLLAGCNGGGDAGGAYCPIF